MLTIDEMIAFTSSDPERVEAISREMRVSTIQACALESTARASMARDGKHGPAAAEDRDL